MEYRKIIEKLEEAALHPSKTVTNTIKSTGKSAIGCFPIYTPEEIIYAAGYVPVGMWGGTTTLQLADKYLQSFCCSIMRSNMEYGMKGAYNMLEAVILPTFCDTLKCICENWKVGVPNIPIIPIVYPQNRTLECGYVYMLDEFKRVKVEIERLSGKKIEEKDIEAAFDIYEEYRVTMREFVEIVADYPQIIKTKSRHLIIKAGQFLDKGEYTKDIKAIIDGLKVEEKQTFKGTKIIATGLMSEPVELLEIFDENQIAIVGDDLAQESRQWRTVTRDDEVDVWNKMTSRVADQRGDTFFYEYMKSRGENLIDMVKEKSADGIVVFMMKFCDPEEYDYPIYKKEVEAAGIPMLYLEIDQQITSYEQLRTRIQSFSEMLISREA
ncbi:MAG: 2-hydroxyacyl-CoA dehydratase [Peptostreptococcaceae bacterium]|nr:2-hydroxyacyl-CoA dehydratase [Peptostreptococcaceae bacterium]